MWSKGRSCILTWTLELFAPFCISRIFPPMLHPEQKRIYQNMTVEQKLRIAADLYDSARELKAAGLRAQHPAWSEKKSRKRSGRSS